MDGVFGVPWVVLIRWVKRSLPAVAALSYRRMLTLTLIGVVDEGRGGQVASLF